MNIQADLNIKFSNFHLDAKFGILPTGITAIFGPSGSGKTTILRTLAGLDRHKNCTIKTGDQIWQNENIFIPAHKRPIGYVFQEPSLFPHLTVKKNIGYGQKRSLNAEQKFNTNEIIELLKLEKLLDRKPHNLSGGESQRVAIARALAVSPKLLLMDEPLSSLDQKLKNEVMPYLEKLQQNFFIPIVYVSHSLNEITRLANQIILIDEGKIQASGEICEILTRLDLGPSHSSNAEAVINTTVKVKDEEFHLTELEFSGGTFTVENIQLPNGSNVRLRIAARDVSITLQPQKETSILNIFPASIDEMKQESSSHSIIRLKLGEDFLLARVTNKSISNLQLVEGKNVFAQIKSVAVLT